MKKEYNKIVISKDLTTLTTGEKLWLARRRKGFPAAVAARRAGFGRNAYAEAEADRAPAPTPSEAGLGPFRWPTLPELLRLARRRSGLGLEEVAWRVKATRVTVLAWEGRGDVLLVHFWRLRGFRFRGSPLKPLLVLDDNQKSSRSRFRPFRVPCRR